MSAIRGGGHKWRSITNLYSFLELVCHFCGDGGIAGLVREEGSCDKATVTSNSSQIILNLDNVDNSARNNEYAGEYPPYLDSYHARYSAPRIAESTPNSARDPT